MRKLRIIIFTVLGLLLLVGVPLIVFNPAVLAQIYIRSYAHNPTGLMVRLTSRAAGSYDTKPMSPSVAHAVGEMLSDRDHDVRREAIFFLVRACGQKENRALLADPDIQEKAKRLVNDRNPDTLEFYFYFLSQVGDGNDSFFQNVLKLRSSNVEVCKAALSALGRSKNPQNLDTILPFLHDKRREVAYLAVEITGVHLREPRVLAAWQEVLADPATDPSIRNNVSLVLGFLKDHPLAPSNPALTSPP